MNESLPFLRLAVFRVLFGLMLAACASAAPPQIMPSVLFQHSAVDLGKSNNFTLSITGDAPSFQWRRDGVDLPGATNRSLIINPASATDEGDYSVVVTNAYGAVTSSPTRLWVTPAANDLIKGNFTNALGVRLPYFYYLPTGYDPARQYPLACYLHGYPGSESQITNATPGVGPGYGNIPALKVLSSFRQQTNDPLIMVWPVRRAGDEKGDWTSEYLQLVSSFLDRFIAEHGVDTNRLYLDGYSQGFHAAWDLLGMRPGFFAAARVASGWQGSSTAASIQHVPMWIWSSATDGGLSTATRSAVRSLLSAGGTPIYTEYSRGAHVESVCMAAMTPANVAWLLAQRLGQACSNQLNIAITQPDGGAYLVTAATNLTLAGTATAPGETVLRVNCTNLTSNIGVVVSGSNDWRVVGIPLCPAATNRVLVTATTTSWAPFFAGNTVFHGTLAVVSSPVRVSIEPRVDTLALTWTGGASPFQVEETTDLSLNIWSRTITNARSPLIVTNTGELRFFRVLSR